MEDGGRRWSEVWKEVTINPMSDYKITIIKLHKTNKSRK